MVSQVKMNSLTTRDPGLINIGYTQYGSQFHAKTRALEKALVKAFPSTTLHYPNGPISLRPSDIPGYSLSADPNGSGDEIEAFGWWRRKDGTPIYDGIEKGLARVAETIKTEGPFDGAIGFSQGGALAAMVAALLENDRKRSFDVLCATDGEKIPYPTSFQHANGDIIQPPLKFAIVYSGFAAPLEKYEGFYNPKIKTPILHFLGSLDTVVDEKRGNQLIAVCESSEKRIIIHPGGHFVPSQKPWLDATVSFVKDGLSGASKGDKRMEQSAEAMDMPF